MSKYSPPSDEDSGDDSDEKAKPKAKRAKKDPNAPKQPMVRLSFDKQTVTFRCFLNQYFFNCTQNAYMLYANHTRALVRKENPDLSMSDLVSY